MDLTRLLARIPSGTFTGSIIRLPLGLIPRQTTVRIRRGPLKGQRWIVGAGVHGYWLGTYEERMQQAVEQTVSAGSVFFDVGAHAGYYSLLASVLVGGNGHVVAFEPHPRNANYLQEHLRLNNTGNVNVIKAAVADASGTALFAPARDGFGGSLSETGSKHVRIVSLDDLVDRGTVPAPNYVKIDVEGAEFRALRGAGKILSETRPTIFLAVHEPEIERKCRQILTAQGYSLRAIDRDAWLCVPA